jgi:hypothetical protein
VQHVEVGAGDAGVALQLLLEGALDLGAHGGQVAPRLPIGGVQPHGL